MVMRSGEAGSRQHDDRLLMGARSKFGKGFQAGAPGHDEIQQDQVAGGAGRKACQQGVSALQKRGGEALPLEDSLDQAPLGRIIIHHDNRLAHSLRPRRAACDPARHPPSLWRHQVKAGFPACEQEVNELDT
jgi:hypothetical protein